MSDGNFRPGHRALAATRECDMLFFAGLLTVLMVGTLVDFSSSAEDEEAERGDASDDDGVQEPQTEGSPLDEVITGGSGDDRIAGNGGDDQIAGYDGNDDIDGGDGDDHLHGDAGDDTLAGGAGEDSLFGGAGADDLRGQDGDDLLAGQQGGDSLAGGGGDDRLIGGLWANLSAGRCRFVMVKDKRWESIEASF